MTKEKFLKILTEINKNKSSIDVSKLLHGNEFVKEGIYNGYDISYVMVKYIFETMSKENITKLFVNAEYAKSKENEIFEKALEYFKSI